MQTMPPKLEPCVDMSPQAIMARLEMVGQLNELCRFLASGKLVPRIETANVENVVAKSASPHSS